MWIKYFIKESKIMIRVNSNFYDDKYFIFILI